LTCPLTPSRSTVEVFKKHGAAELAALKECEEGGIVRDGLEV
jgi:hypothetical protein